MNAVIRYLKDLIEIRSTGAGVPETSYYPALSNLLNEVGRGLSPAVRCVINLANRGAGNPDGGLFTASQFRTGKASAPKVGQLPERGVIEVKPTSDDAWVVASGEQVSRYWGRYGLILVTNYRDFVLIGKTQSGAPIKLETYRLAESESEFWKLAKRPQLFGKVQEKTFTEYLRRVMLHAAPLSAPRDVAWFLASYARDAQARIEEAELPALADLREALEQALGLKFQGDKGEHFFRSTLVQTLFYGLFSAWVLHHKYGKGGNGTEFDWKQAAWSLELPIISALFEEVAAPSRLKPLGLVEPMNWAAGALNRVDRTAFFAVFDQGEAVPYFYEPFLEHFDPELRKELGVWYTPRELVQYMVARVDAALQTELGIADGLADPRVFVLDPCCGTGAYLVEVLRRIAERLRSKGSDALLAHDIKSAAVQRVFGFEIMPAPFVISHLQLNLLLRNLGAPLQTGSVERAGVFLTNALTGWEARDQPPLSWPQLEAERAGARDVKIQRPILVVIGNPPYNAFAGVSPEQEEDLVETYKGAYKVVRPTTARVLPEGAKVRAGTRRPVATRRRYRLNDPVKLGGWGIRKFNLDDLYVRFFRVAERRIVERTGTGIVCLISNFSYLSDASFVIMRERFVKEFDALWFDCLNGDSRETGKTTPDGKPDPSVFSTDKNPAGIRVGTTIGLLVRTRERNQSGPPAVRYRDFWGAGKRAALLESLADSSDVPKYRDAAPTRANRFSFRPESVSDRYRSWPRVVDICGATPISGLQEMRRGALMDVDGEAVGDRIREYLDKDVSWDVIRGRGHGLSRDAGGFKASAARRALLGKEAFHATAIRRYALYPFDTRWCYHSNTAPFWNRPRPQLVAQAWKDNRFFITRMNAERPHEQIAVMCTSVLPDYHLLRPNAVAIPIRLRQAGDRGGDGLLGRQTTANLSQGARRYLKGLGIEECDSDQAVASLLWMHSLAIAFSPAYTVENGQGIRQDWPRIPLPNDASALFRSAALGEQVAALLDTEREVEGVTVGAVRAELRMVAVLAKADGSAVNPGVGDLRLSVGWGFPGRDGVIMPGGGRSVSRAFEVVEVAPLKNWAAENGLDPRVVETLVGEATSDVFINESVFWRNIPRNVWEYTIGGYQVIKKWLSYRENSILGRDLEPGEARQVTDTARRILALVLLQPALNQNYRQVESTAIEWGQS